MQSKLLKITSIICIFFVILSVFPNEIFADNKADTDSWVLSAENFLKAGQEDIGIDNGQLIGASNDIYNTLTSVGMIISVIVGVILGIQFMMASAEDKAKVKEALIPYLVGCVVIFGAFGIWKIVINTFSGI